MTLTSVHMPVHRGSWPIADPSSHWQTRCPGAAQTARGVTNTYMEGADMAQVSKRIRFEVLKRDNYSCTYCGAKAPDVALHVDHVIPQALGGSNDPSNLTTACKDCNAGKGSTHPTDQVVVEVHKQAEAWREAMQLAADEMSRKPFDTEVARVLEVFDGWCPQAFSEQESIRRVLISGLPIDQVVEAAEIARYKPYVKTESAFRYFHGVCRKKLEALQARALEIMEEGK